MIWLFCCILREVTGKDTGGIEWKRGMGMGIYQVEVRFSGYGNFPERWVGWGMVRVVFLETEELG
jgi:hypothetical protein